MQSTLQQEKQVLYALLLSYDPTSSLLPTSMGDSMSPEALSDTLMKHQISIEQLIECYERATALDNSSWHKMASEIGNPACEEADQQRHDSEEALHCCWTGCGQDKCGISRLLRGGTMSETKVSSLTAEMPEIQHTTQRTSLFDPNPKLCFRH